ncbi:glycerol-3-phosphate dehydrogenase/oxidase [Blastococcus sp. MG754426]|uniref:glycerol-3-phosphate dehydrogenase/oxidase n=1 Tax=unclassified Blastococcus TaxID=2619396 RepID=UPI001EEFECEE|nr:MULTISPECIES: glycerol-3-phosphate dehydrogenase/oxidase [unclassified Blastococcus]MCF6507682.1 glycerol-3-phosphate dehydrogenase/oxidase [Blastococcus sp. MG754426]MCF6511179.1 glycerol-3-phosphate dehydrogenase/oxidase [Blastococcus sp. MG754427]
MIGSLSPARRARDLAAVAGAAVDVVVVGAGVTGAGVALDAASRGLSVLLCERADLAAGTSRWSSKLVHGGLRYLAHGELGLARESARERAVLMGATAPHLVRPLPFLVPDAAGRDVTALAELGGRLGDAVRFSVPGGRRSLPPTRRVGAAEVGRLVAGVRPGGGGVVFWDGQLVDDARLVVALVRTAAAHGARVLTGAAVTAVDGADVHVATDEGPVTVRAGAVVNAAGVWAQRLAPGLRLVPSRGSHLVVPGVRLGSPSAALTVPLPGSRSRYVFALPQADGLVYLGLTDEPVEGPVPDDDATPSEAEVAQLLGTVNRVLAEPLTPGDVVGAYAGYRPLVLPAAATPGSATADLSRRHLLAWDGPVLSVVGGKLTTYRAMAEEAVDAVVARLGRGAARSVTARLALVGAAPRVALDRLVAPPRLVARYGTEAPAVEALGPALVVAGRPETVGELRFAVRHEGARTVADLLDRRTRIGLVPADRERAVPVAEQVLAEA